MIAWTDKQCVQSFMSLLSLLFSGNDKKPISLFWLLSGELQCTYSAITIWLGVTEIYLLLKLTFPGYVILFHTDFFFPQK